MARPACVTLCYGPDGPVYLVRRSSRSKDLAFTELQDALEFAQKYNNGRHQGVAPFVQTWDDRQLDFRQGSLAG